MTKNSLIVKEPEELLLMRGDFSESALKLGAYLIANLEKNKVFYKINIKDYLKKFDKKIGDYNYLYNVTKELSQKQFEINDRFNKRFTIFNFISSADYYDGILEIEFSQKLLTYLLEIKEKYLKYDIKNIMSLSSKYSIRLYKILKDAFEKNARYAKKAEFEITINDLRELLAVKSSYRFNNIKVQILEKSKQELEKNTDILFDYEEIKTGRKVTHLRFFIRENKKNIQTENRIQDNYFKSRKAFVALLRKKYSGNQRFWGYKTIDGQNFWLGLDKNGLVYGWNEKEDRDFNAVESARLYELWLKIAQNSVLYQELVTEAVDLRDISQNNKELFNELNEDIIALKNAEII